MNRILLVLSLLFAVTNGNYNFIAIPSEESIELFDTEQCGPMRNAYAEAFQQCARDALGSWLFDLLGSFLPIEDYLDLLEESEESESSEESASSEESVEGPDRRKLKRKKFNCGQCRKNPEACCLLGTHDHCSVCVTAPQGKNRRHRLRKTYPLGTFADTALDWLRRELDLTSKLPEINSKCKEYLDDKCKDYHDASGTESEMQCWSCSSELGGFWNGTVTSYSVLNGED